MEQIIDHLVDAGFTVCQNLSSEDAAITKELRRSKIDGKDLFTFFLGSVKKGIPVIFCLKKTAARLEKKDDDGTILLYRKTSGGSSDGFNMVRTYAVNEAVYFAQNIIFNTGRDEVIAIGAEEETGACRAYIISASNECVPKEICEISDIASLKPENSGTLISKIRKLRLSESEIKTLTDKLEESIDLKVKEMHQSIYDYEPTRNALTINEKLYLFCALFMAGIHAKGFTPLRPEDITGSVVKMPNGNIVIHDGTVIMDHVRMFLKSRQILADEENNGVNFSRISTALSLMSSVLDKPVLRRVEGSESFVKKLFVQMHEGISPYFGKNLSFDFTGLVLDALNDWAGVENDKKNDVVLTPRYVTRLMAKLCRTNKDSYVWDNAMGFGGFLISAAGIMMDDAKKSIKNTNKLNEKIKSIKNEQVFGSEIAEDIYAFADINMLLMGACPSLINKDSLCDDSLLDRRQGRFPADVFLLNPPYSAGGNGFVFAQKAMEEMETGYAAVLIQSSAGSGQGVPYTKDILVRNTLLASIKMPENLFGLKASVSVSILLFKVNRPHSEKDEVIFIDFSNDGYSRKNRKKASRRANLRDVDHANERYEEVEEIVLGRCKRPKYYTEKNGCLIKDTISFNGDDWLIENHVKDSLIPEEEDFMDVIDKFMKWEITRIGR